jgi:hypothetical protein
MILGYSLSRKSSAFFLVTLDNLLEIVETPLSSHLKILFEGEVFSNKTRKLLKVLVEVHGSHKVAFARSSKR